MIYFALILCTFTFSWYSSKLLKDVSGKDQYWHIAQTIFLICVMAVLPLIILGIYARELFSYYLVIIIAYAPLHSFLFNTLLNIYRKQPFKHRGKYDMSFGLNVVLALLGLSVLIANEISDYQLPKLLNEFYFNLKLFLGF